MSLFLDLPPSAIIVLEKLENQGPMTPKDISRAVSLAPRTISFALGKLVRKNLCKKIPNLSDMRQPLYLVNEEKTKELRAKFEHVFKRFLQ
jgi:DNA-binding MarR family transcriptional regulator